MMQQNPLPDENVTLKYHSPSDIFCYGIPVGSTEMMYSKNKDLIKSFLMSRILNDERFTRNAAAIQLCKEDGTNYITDKGLSESVSEMYFDFCGLRERRTSYGHSERIFMRNALNTLMREHEDLENELRFKMNKADLLDDLKKLTDRASEYKQYLQENKLTVKILSERPPCTDAQYYSLGGTCESFLKEICPKGSHFGYIVKDYIPLQDYRDGAPKVMEAFKNLMVAYFMYIGEF